MFMKSSNAKPSLVKKFQALSLRVWEMSSQFQKLKSFDISLLFIDYYIKLMNVQIEYEICLLNNNKVKGNIAARIGQLLEELKYKILLKEGLKNLESFICTSQDMQKITSYTQTLTFNERPSSKKQSKISDKPSRKDSSEVLFEQSSMDFDNQAQTFVARSPQKPPVVRGSVRRSNRFFCCMSSVEYLQLRVDSLNFYSSKRYDQIQKSIPINEIVKIRSYRKKEVFFLNLRLLEEQIDFSFKNSNICKQWMGYLSQSMEFNNFLKEKKIFSKAQSFHDYLKGLREEENEQVVLLQQSNLHLQTIHEEQPDQREVSQKTKNLTTFSEFQIQYKIGSGSFSIVYLAKRNNKVYALKQLSKEKLLAKNQMKYALTQLKVLSVCETCPYIIPLRIAFQTLDYLYLALKYVPTGDLSQQLRIKGQFSPDEALILLFLHKNKIIYRDLKPENIMIDQKGHIYLVDFGLAKKLSTEDQLAESFLGTPLYLAPQRFSGLGSINFKSDIYGVGCIFYEVLHGETAFKGNNYGSLVNKIKNEAPEYRKDLPPEFISFLQQSLQKNPERRLSQMSKHSIFQGIIWQQIGLRMHQGIKIQQISVSNGVQISYKVDEDYNEQTFPKRVITGWQFNSENQIQ